MQKQTLNGAEYFELAGEIEAIGSSRFDTMGELFPHVRFRDGKLVKNIVADNATAPYVDAGASGRFFFRRWGKGLVLLGTSQNGIGYRAADAEFWSKYPRRNLAIAIGGFLLALFLVYWVPQDGIGFAIAALVPLAIGIWALAEFRKDSQLVALIHSLEEAERSATTAL